MQTDQQPIFSDFVCIRHGRSTFNQGEVDFFKRNPEHKYPEADEVLFSPQHIDAKLAEEGVQQCKRLKNDELLKSVDLVLVSPLTRALQSAQIIFGDSKVPKIVHPELAQTFRYSCDLSDPLDAKISHFSSFDFSSMGSMSSHWYIQDNLGVKNRKVLQGFLEKQSSLAYIQQQKQICRMVGLRHFYESNQELKDRTRKMRTKLVNYREKYNKIAVVAHMWAIRYLISSDFDHNFEPKYLPEIINARPYWFTLAKLGIRR